MDALPTMKASDLDQRATAFAEELANGLENFNRQYPYPQMTQEATDYINKQFQGKIPGPTPNDFIPTFKAIFCRYIASHWVITP